MLKIHERHDLDGFSDITDDLTKQILDGISKFSSDILYPLNAIGDEHGCLLEEGLVSTPPGFVDAYRKFCDAGWNRLGVAEEFGGENFPGVVTMAASEIVAAANSSFSLYSGLTNGALAVILNAGDDWICDKVAPSMASGNWTGTMCLTEPHCGTDLKLMSTKATPTGDGSYHISGTKIFISGGDHDLSENIIHLVLAKLPDKNGKYTDDLSTVNLFVVPKFSLEEPNVTNGVSVGGVEKKMGLKGNATCILNFENAIGYKLGSTKKDGSANSKSSGMSAMFDMMNYARLGTGVQALATASAAYAKSANYARERISGRAINPDLRTKDRADPIIVHPDVRRMLMKQRSFLDGGRAMGLWVALLLDTQARSANADEKRDAGLLASFLTPVVKAYFSDRGFEASNLAVQIFGGHGYIRENGVEQHVRDGRIFQLYEGANGIQALDLVARKLPADGGASLGILIAKIQEILASIEDVEGLETQHAQLVMGVSILEEAAAFLALLGTHDFETVSAASYDFLNIVGTVAIGFMWAWMGKVAVENLAANRGSPTDNQRRISLGNYWAEREMPSIHAALASAKSGAATLMSVSADNF